MNDSTEGHLRISNGTISKALALLLEDFGEGNHSLPVDEQTNRDAHTLFGLLNHKAYALESVLSTFGLHVRREIANIRRQQNILAPIHRLPAELLQCIFLLAVPEHFRSGVDTTTIHEEYARPRYQHPPAKWDPKVIPPETGYSIAVNMATVSSHWYRLARSTPQLWSCLDTRHSLGVAKILLKRSKQSPLHITCSNNVNDQHQQRFMKLVASHLYRWRTFESFVEFAKLSTLLDLKEYSAPLLERWILRGYIRWMFREKVPAFILTQSPNLRDFHIAPMENYPFGAQVLSGLTNLSIAAIVEKNEGEDEAFTMEQFELLLSASPNLETIFISGRGDITNNQTNLFSVRLPNLKSIYLYGVSSTTAVGLLLSIFPKPGDFQAAKIFGEWDVDWFQTMNFDHTRHGCVLDLTLRPMTWLSFTSNDDDDDDDNYGCYVRVGTEIQGIRTMSLEILSPTEMVQEAIVSLFHLDDPTSLRDIELELNLDYRLDASIRLREGLYLCPRLKTLTITSSQEVNFGLRSFVDLLVPPSKWGPEVDRLVLKNIDDLGPVIYLFKNPPLGDLGEESTPRNPWDQLRKLEVQYLKQSSADGNAEEKAKLLALMKELDIDVDLVPVSN